MPFIHRFLTPREERNMVYKTFNNAVKKQYPDDHAEIMGQIWKMPYEKLLKASLSAHHVNIYIDLAASRITGVSQYDKYVKHVRRLSRVVGEIEDTPFLDLPRTDDVLMDHLFMKVCEFCPQHQTAEAITNELYEQGYIETRADIVDMLEQPKLLRKRVRHLYKQIEEGSLSDLEEEQDPANVNYHSNYPDTVSLTSSFPYEPSCGGAQYGLGCSTNHSASHSTIQSSTSAIFTNNFDELFEQAAAAAASNCSSEYGGIMYDSSLSGGTPARALSPQLDALHLEMVNETAAVNSSPTSPSRDLMKFSPGPRIRIVVEDGDNSDFDPLLSSQNRKYTKQRNNKNDADPNADSDSDDILSSSETPTGSKTTKGLEAAFSAAEPEEAVAPAVVRPRVYSMPNVSIDEKAQRRLRKNQKQQQHKRNRPSSFGTAEDDDHNDDPNCDICDYEKRMSKISLSVDENCVELRQYLDETGDLLPICVDLPVGCDLSVLLDAGELEPDEALASAVATTATNDKNSKSCASSGLIESILIHKSPTSSASPIFPTSDAKPIANDGITKLNIDTNSMSSLPSSSAISINMPSTTINSPPPLSPPPPPPPAAVAATPLINLSDPKQPPQPRPTPPPTLRSTAGPEESGAKKSSTRRKPVAEKC